MRAELCCFWRDVTTKSKSAPEGLAKPPGAVRTGPKLPWDKARIANHSASRPDRYELDLVCGKIVAGCISRRAGTNAIASKPIALGNCVAGKRPNANAITANYRPTESGTLKPRQNVGVNERAKPAKIAARTRVSPKSTARGHTARNILPSFVTGQDATNHRRRTRVPRRDTAGLIAATPYDESATANVSGWHAINTRPHALVTPRLDGQVAPRPGSNQPRHRRHPAAAQNKSATIGTT